MITIEIHDDEVRAAFDRLREAAIDPQPILAALGERLAETTKRRFETSTGPDGQPWAPNSPVTLALLTKGMGKSYRTKAGGLNTKGTARLAGKKPLIGESKALSHGIDYQLEPNAVIIGSPMKYAGVQQFGAAQGALGRNRRGGPIPWGTIPARPFLGVSADDKAEILEILRDALARNWGGQP